MGQNLKEVSFMLPIGYKDDDGNIHREGKMRAVTAEDEIEINNNEKISFQKRYHDILLLARIITNLGDLNDVTDEVIVGMYEVDFRYLQTLYHQMNGNMSSSFITYCPKCSSPNKVSLQDTYKKSDLYFRKSQEAEEVK